MLRELRVNSRAVHGNVVGEGEIDYREILEYNTLASEVPNVTPIELGITPRLLDMP